MSTTADPANLWGEPAVELAEPIGLTTARKDLHNSLSRTLHCVASAEDDPEVLKAWWLTVDYEEGRLTGLLHGGTPPDWRRITDVADEPTVVLSLSARFAQEAAAAATGGESGVVRVEYRDEQKPALYRSPGLDEWVMPVRTAPVAEVPR